MIHGTMVNIRKPDDRNTTRMIIDSELFDELKYEIKQDHLIIFGGKDGTLAALPLFVKEITAMLDVYGGEFI